MHDITFANKILAVLNDKVRDTQRSSRITVHIVLGPSTHVNARNLTEAFNALPGKAQFKNVKLDIEAGTAAVECAECGAVSPVSGPVFACPACGKRGLKLHPCEEFVIRAIDIEE